MYIIDRNPLNSLFKLIIIPVGFSDTQIRVFRQKK